MASTPAMLDDVFRQAVDSFKASLTEKQRREFQGCTRKHVEDTIRGIESRLASQRQQRHMRRMAKFVEGMSQLGKVIEVFVNVDSTVAFVWGPIKFVLLIKTAGTWVETLDCLLDTYAEIGEFLPGLSQYEKFLRKHPAIGVHLQSYYCDVLEFHRQALLVFSRPSWKTAFHSAWKTFKSHFGPILTKLKRHRDLLSDEKITAALIEVNDFRQSFEDKLDELSREVQKLHLDNHEEDTLRHREALDRKRHFVLSKLDPPDYGFDLERALKERGASTSGDWLQTDAAFRQWADMTTMGQRVLYLNGIPGTGKTILASGVVTHLQTLQDNSSQNVRKFLVLYFFFRHHQPDKRTFPAMLLSLLSQVVLQDEVVLDLVYQRMVSTDQQKIRSVPMLRELAELAIGAQSLSFVVVDGLDECVGNEPAGAHHDAAQGEVIDWLEALITTSNPGSTAGAGGQTDERCIRLLISGQRNGFLEERLKSWPAIQADSSPAHMSDIETYSTAMSLQIQKRFRVDEATRMDIVSRVNTTAAGMFLYAKVVLDNLLRQPTLGHFKRELREENFPKGMDQAYERVVIQILECPDEQQTSLTRRILELVLCAERPLFWKEIQSRFCIDIESETADSDFRLLEPCKTYCGSLVEVSRNNGAKSGPDEMVEIVHETARTYLFHTGRFRPADLHKEMALFCAQYLSSTPFEFEPEGASSNIKRHCLTGYYGFLDYAVANWWKHLKSVYGTLDEDTALTVHHLLSRLKSAQNEETAPGDAPPNRLSALIDRLQDDGKEWETAFSLEGRIKPIRDCIESLFMAPDAEKSTELDGIQDLYGRVNYKCTKPWCHFFLVGFDTLGARQKHMAEHERPFRCATDGWYGCQIGFANESELVKHNSRIHSPESRQDFKPSSKTRRIDIFQAAKQGKLDVIQDLVGSGANVNARDSSSSTPLYLAAKAGHYHVCRWLLEHGAKANARCGYNTPLHAAVANREGEVALLLVQDHGADVYARNRDDVSVLSLMEAQGLNAVSATLPPEVLRHKTCTRFKCRVPLPSESGILLQSRAREDLRKAITECNVEAVRLLTAGSSAACFDLHGSVLETTEWPASPPPKALFSVLSRARAATDPDALGRLDHIANLLLDTGRLDVDTTSDDGDLALHKACQLNLPKTTARLFSLSSFPSLRNRSRKTPFDLLLEDNPENHAARVSLVSTLVESGLVNLDERDDTHLQTPLHRACAQGVNVELIKLLLRHTRQLEVKDGDGLTPLDLAIRHRHVPAHVAFLEHLEANHLNGNGRLLTEQERQCFQLLTLIGRRDPEFLTKFRRSLTASLPPSAYHCGAYYLDIDILRSINPFNLEYVRWIPPPGWEKNLLSLPGCHGETVFFRPLFIAMNRALVDHQQQGKQAAAGHRTVMPDGFREIFNTLLSAATSGSETNHLSEDLDVMSAKSENIKIRLIGHCCDGEMVTRMAEAGLSLRWEFLRWDEKGGTIYITDPGETEKHPIEKPETVLSNYFLYPGETVRYPIEKLETVLSILQGGRCRFVDVLRENFNFAEAVLGSGHISPGSLNLEDELGIVSLAAKRQNVNVLRHLFRLGFDGGSALLKAAEADRMAEVDILLKTQDEVVFGAAMAAYYDIAVQKGTPEDPMARMLAAELAIGDGSEFTS